MKYFPEIVRYVQRFEVVKTERFYAGSVDDEAAEVELVHFGEGGGVLAFSGVIGKFADV